MAERELHLFVDNSNVLLEGRRFSEMERNGRPKLGAFLDDSLATSQRPSQRMSFATGSTCLSGTPFGEDLGRGPERGFATPRPGSCPSYMRRVYMVPTPMSNSRGGSVRGRRLSRQ